ncbi:MAG: hypothetical protein ACPL1A_09520 [Candidatus Kapaibacteriota bacterium]
MKIFMLFFNRKISSFLYIALLLFVVNTNSSKAITESYLNISTVGSTNAFYIDSIKNVVSNSFGYGINYYPDSSKFGYFADLSYLNYINYTDRNFFNSNLGFMYTYDFSNELKDLFNTSASFSNRFDASTYSIFDYLQFLLNFSYIHNFSETTSFDISYFPRYRSYLNYSNINYYENALSASYSDYFETKTNLNFTATLLNKNYLTSSQHSSMMTMHINEKPKTTNFIQKKGPKWNMNPGDAQNTSNNLNSMQSSATSITQLTGNLHLAQNIFESTGLELSIFASRYLSKMTPVNIDGAFAFIGEAELFDDPYSFENSSISLTLNQILPYDIFGKMTFSYLDKNYNTYILQSDSSKLQRKDKVYFSNISLTKDFEIRDFLFNSISIELAYTYFKNESNLSEFLFNYNDLFLSCTFNF